jgi:hypothetical protein
MIESQCQTCRHHIPWKPGQESLCAAFPDGDGIPLEILTNEHDHRKPYPGDHGIRYERERKPAPVPTS